MDKYLFKYYMSKNGDTTKTIAKAIEVSPVSVLNKLNGYRGDFTRAEIAIIAERWNLAGDEVKQIFLN